MCWYYSQRVARRHLVNTPLACCASMRPRRRDHKQRKIGVWKLVIAGQEDPCSDPEWITPSRSCPARPRSCPARPVPWGDAQATSVLESFGCTFELIFWAHAAGLVLAPLSTPAGSFFYFGKVFQDLLAPHPRFPVLLAGAVLREAAVLGESAPAGRTGNRAAAPQLCFSRSTRDGLGVPRGGGWGDSLAHLAAPPISSKPGRTTPRSGALSDPDRVLAKPCRLACPYLSFIRILLMCLCERPQRQTGFEVTLPLLSDVGDLS